MASPSAQIDSDATLSDTSSSVVPIDEIPPLVIDVQEEEVLQEVVAATEQWKNNEVELPKWLKVLAGNQAQDWRAFARKRITGQTDRTYIHKEYRHQFRSKPDVTLFVKSEGVKTGTFKGKKLHKKKIAGMDAPYAGTSKSAGRASTNHARPKRSLVQSHSIDDEDMPPGFL